MYGNKSNNNNNDDNCHKYDNINNKIIYNSIPLFVLYVLLPSKYYKKSFIIIIFILIK